MRTAETTDRFFRPPDSQSTRRNYRRVQVQRVLSIAGNVMVVVTFALALAWIWQTTQRDARFAIRDVSATGAVNTSQHSIDGVMKRYMGGNLFQLDIETLKRDLLELEWVANVAIEKELPGQLTIHITERRPVAIVARGNGLHYVDAAGLVFAEVDPQFGVMDLPLITGAEAETVASCIEVLRALGEDSPDLYSRISEITPADGGTWRVWDRELGTAVYIGEQPAKKWKTLYAIAAREGFGTGTIEYADLRFEGRVIVRPRTDIVPLHEAEVATEAGNGEPSDGSGRPGNA